MPPVHGRAGTAFCSGVLAEPVIEQLKSNPRARFAEAIRNNDAATCLVKTAEIHGHYCPGSALGVMASLYGLGLVGDGNPEFDGVMENLLAIVETNSCFSDGVQAVSGCTLGNNSLVYRDLGKLAVTFAVRGKKEGVRVRVLPEFKRCVDEAVPDFFPLMDRVVTRREGDPGELKLFREKGREAAFALLRFPFDSLFAAMTVIPDIPGYAPITETVVCAECGEPVMASKIRGRGPGTGTCFSCNGEYLEVEGRGIVHKDSKRKTTGARGRSMNSG